MRNYICKWPNGDVVLISARDKQQVREILDEQADPGGCQIVRLKGAFAIELLPKVPKPPRPTGGYHDPGFRMGNEEYQPPADPTMRPNILRWVGNAGRTTCADLYQEYGGQLTEAETAAVQRWKAATQQQQQQQQQPGAAAAAAADDDEPWVTEQQLDATGMLGNPYYVQVDLGRAEYGPYSSRVQKQITKHFFPKTHDALKVVADMQMDDYSTSRRIKAAAEKDLRAALSADIDDKEKADELDRKLAKLLADASNGDREAMLQIITDQTANVYGYEPDDEDDEDEDDEEDDEEEDSDGDVGMAFLSAIRHGRHMEVARDLGVQP